MEVIPVSKRTYRATSVNDVNLPRLQEAVRGSKIIIGVDVAKKDFKAALKKTGVGVPLRNTIVAGSAHASAPNVTDPTAIAASVSRRPPRLRS